MHGEHPRQMRPTPILLVAGRLRVVEGEQFHNASNDEIQRENSAEHNPQPLQVAALRRRRHHPTVRRGIDWWRRLWVHYRRTCACRVLTATDRRGYPCDLKTRISVGRYGGEPLVRLGKGLLSTVTDRTAATMSKEI